MSISDGLDSLVFGELGFDVRVVVDDGPDLMVCVSKSLQVDLTLGCLCDSHDERDCGKSFVHFYDYNQMENIRSYIENS